uniref:Leucine-rich repeat-containing N-terminal plant-type domain-containing protein n=1 Tax=Oryza meridionalis TaxID=40149 RepID=A0A0E0CNF2_9ORYZ
MFLNNKNIPGALPANIGFSKLSYLALANNKLTGPIPPSISHLQDSLLEVLLFNNQLSGCLPHELGLLTKAAVIDAGMNQLTGPIPSSFSCLTSVEQLNMGGNRLYGEIPDALCKLAAGPAGRLANLTLSSNYFTSVRPACLSLIKDGILNVKNNCIPGFANQRRPAECASFLSQPKTCPAASATHEVCPTAAANGAAAPADRVAKDYSSYVTYATLHD